MQEALHQSGLPKNVVQFVETTDRSMVTQMLQASKYLDVIIHDGGKSLVKRKSNKKREFQCSPILRRYVMYI